MLCPAPSKPQFFDGEGLMGIVHKYLESVLPKIWDRALEDPRRCEVNWGFSELIEALMYGLISGAKTFRDIEFLTGRSGRRVPDTTLHDLVVQLDPEPIEEELARGVKEANRSHQLDNKELPFRLTVIDGKNISTTTKPVDEFSINRSQKGCDKYVQHAVRAFHVSSTVKLHMAQQRVPRGTNENAVFPLLLDKLVEHYGNTNLLEVLSFDAGFLGSSNAQRTVDAGLSYIFALKNPEIHPITRTAMELLDKRTRPNKVVTEQMNGEAITRSLYRCQAPSVNGWEHAKELWRLHKVTVNLRTGKTKPEDHYYVTNLPVSRLSDNEVLKAIRLHWNIENNANWILDTVWKEDTRPFCNLGLEAIALMRMIAHNLVTIFKLRRLNRTAAGSWTWSHLLSVIQELLFPVNQHRVFVTL